MDLKPLFCPKSIAVIGASREKEKVGNMVLRNLLPYKKRAEIYPINPWAKRILGLKCYPSVESVGKEVDLGIIATKAEITPKLLLEAKNLKSCIIISSGFAEAGNARLGEKVKLAASKNNILILGPNCIGIQVPSVSLNATFMKPALKGDYALISQSGAFCSSIISWSAYNKVGFSKIVSLGNAYGVNFHDLIDYFQADPNTKKIILYIEGLSQGKEFMNACKRSKKPIYALKVGKTEEGKLAAKTHTGAMAGSYGVYKDIFRQVGVTEIKTMKDAFMFLKMSKMERKEVIILSNAGGPGTAAADLLSEEGVALKKISDKALKKLNRLMPENWSKRNPADILGDATPERYEQAIKLLSEEGANILVILTPQEMTNPKETARRISKYKNVLGVFIGGREVVEARQILESRGIPAFEFSEQAAKCLGLLR
jgi:acetyltransferase